MTIYRNKRLGQYVCVLHYGDNVIVSCGLTRMDAMSNAFRGIL